MTTTTIEQKEKTAQLIWTGFILAFFIIQAIIWIAAISFTSSDLSHAVVAGYEEQALKWDEAKSMRRASAELGWDCRIVVDGSADIRGNRAITLVIADKNNQPVENAKIAVRAFHRGRAAEVQDLAFQEVGPGIYSSKVQIQRTGQWQFSGRISSENRNYLIEQQQFIQIENR